MQFKINNLILDLIITKRVEKTCVVHKRFRISAPRSVIDEKMQKSRQFENIKGMRDKEKKCKSAYDFYIDNLKGEFTFFFYSRNGCPPIRGVKLDGS